MKYISYPTSNPASLLQRTVAITTATVLGGLALMFSAILFVIILSIAAVAWAYLTWKTREVRKQLKNSPHYDASSKHKVIEGEVIRMDESQVRIRG